ncbi:MAG: hydrogenase iron-sulfur subunit [Thermoplasmata archaeon]|nr:MAG: hydrogenase iron-sulfur subunit [Thermoplasmata archaeon]
MASETTQNSDSPTVINSRTYMPRIIGFLCNWCSYAGADLAGVSRFHYPPSLRIIRVMCSGRLDPHIIFESFIQGADAVFIGGCHPGDCHYLEGNYQAERKIKMVRKLLERTGMDPNRLKLEWIAASEGERFARTISDYTDEIKALGPSPVAGPSPDMEIVENLLSAQKAVYNFRLRAIVSKERKLIEEGNVYGVKKSQEEFDEFFDEAIQTEYTRQQILKQLSKGALSVKDLSSKLNIPTEIVLDNIVILRKENQIALEKIENFTPRYISLLEGGD